VVGDAGSTTRQDEVPLCGRVGTGTPDAALPYMESKLWYGVLGRGAVALLFALLAIGSTRPWLSVRPLAWLFAAYAIIDSGLSVFIAVRGHRKHAVHRDWPIVVEALLSAGLGVVALLLPSVLALRIIGGLRALVVGTSDVVWGAGKEHGDDLIEMAGIVAFLLGVLLLAWPGPATVALPWLLGLASMLSGALLFAGALSKLRARAVALGQL
jgi:uncharacterized membrane protein HdeD (DUF308 family)